MPPFSSHRNINKGSHRNPRWRGKWRVGPPTFRSYATGGSWWRRLGHVQGEFIWRQRVHGCSSELCKHTNRTSYRNDNCKDLPKSETVGGQNIRDAINKRTASYNEALLSGNMSEYKASCYALRRAVRAAKFRYSERIESHFQLNDPRRMWQGLRTICAFGNKSSAACQEAAGREARIMWSPWRRTRFAGP